MPRDLNHDYRSRCIYHITVTKCEGAPVFSEIKGNLSDVRCNLSPIGRIIRDSLRCIPMLSPQLEVLQYVIMPDHIHFILFVKGYLDQHIGKYIGEWKNLIAREVIHHLSLSGKVFNDDYYDRRLRPWQKLDDIYVYVRRNPYRLLVRRLKRDFFRRIHNFEMNGVVWEAYGNIQIFANPFKYQVQVHRADSAEEFEAKKQCAIYYADNGGVVVSPFFSPREKEIRDAVIAARGRMILLINEPFGERYRPGGRNFSLCEEGRLLIIAPKHPLPTSRATCLHLNAVAAAIATPPGSDASHR